MFGNPKLTQKFVKSLELLLFQSKLFGVVTFNLTTFRPSKFHIFFNIVAVIAYSAVISYSLYNTALESSGLVYKATDIIILVVNAGYVITTLVCALVNRDLFVEFLTKVIDFDTQLQTLGIKIKYQKYQKRVLGEFLLRWLVTLTNVGTLLYIAWSNGANIIVESMAYYLILINSVICHQTSALVLMLKIRFKILNRQIENLVRFFLKTKVSGRNTELLTLNKICALHHHLSKLVKLFNEVFGLVLLCMFGVSFVIIVISVFYFTSFLQTELYIPNLLNPWMSNMTFIANVVYICDVCYSTIEEVGRTGELIHKIDTEDHDIRDEIEMFSLQIANEQVEFNAAGFFPINYTLIFSIIGGVTTYIIILIQLSQTIIG